MPKSPKQYVGEVVKTVGLVATPQTSSKVKIAQFDNDALVWFPRGGCQNSHWVCRVKVDNAQLSIMR